MLGWPRRLNRLSTQIRLSRRWLQQRRHSIHTDGRHVGVRGAGFEAVGFEQSLRNLEKCFCKTQFSMDSPAGYTGTRTETPKRLFILPAPRPSLLSLPCSGQMPSPGDCFP